MTRAASLSILHSSLSLPLSHSSHLPSANRRPGPFEYYSLSAQAKQARSWIVPKRASATGLRFIEQGSNGLKSRLGAAITLRNSSLLCRTVLCALAPREGSALPPFHSFAGAPEGPRLQIEHDLAYNERRSLLSVLQDGSWAIERARGCRAQPQSMQRAIPGVSAERMSREERAVLCDVQRFRNSQTSTH